jgi:hypothetical protein
MTVYSDVSQTFQNTTFKNFAVQYILTSSRHHVPRCLTYTLGGGGNCFFFLSLINLNQCTYTATQSCWECKHSCDCSWHFWDITFILNKHSTMHYSLKSAIRKSQIALNMHNNKHPLRSNAKGYSSKTH